MSWAAQGLSMKARGAKRAKPKFGIGQVVLNRYSRDNYIKIRAKKFGAGKNNSEVWAYSSKTGFMATWYEETMLRPLTARERGGHAK